MNNNEYKLEKEKICKDDKLFLVEINGQEIQTKNQFIEITQNLFRFPSDCKDNWDGYIDWMNDLGWLKKDGYILVIHDFKQFMFENMEEKELLIDIFFEDILSYWQWEIKKCIIGGKRRLFLLILVID